ncbi:MAG: hypothetical protein ACRDZ2_06875 [Ilumatobacteraceae bacterium]
MSTFEELAGRLVEISAELDQLSFDLLQEAVAEGATRRPDDDKVVMQARRAVEKAAHLLRRAGPGE